MKKSVRNMILLLIIHLIIFNILIKFNLTALTFIWGGCYVLLYQRYVIDVRKGVEN